MICSLNGSVLNCKIKYAIGESFPLKISVKILKIL